MSEHYYKEVNIALQNLLIVARDRLESQPDDKDNEVLKESIEKIAEYSENFLTRTQLEPLSPYAQSLRDSLKHKGKLNT